MTRLTTALVAIGAALALATPAPLRAAEAKATYERCHQHVNLVFVPLENTKREVLEPFVPLETAGHADLQVKALACEHVSVDGTDLDGPVRMGWVGVDVGCPKCEGNFNFYLLGAVTDSEALARWLVRGTELTVVHVPFLPLDYDPIDAPVSAAPYFFHAPEPAPLPFEIRGTASEQGAQGLLLDVTWWQTTRRGIVRLAHPKHTNFVSSGTGEVRALDRAMEKILGARSAPSAIVLSERIDCFDEQKKVFKEWPDAPPLARCSQHSGRSR